MRMVILALAVFAAGAAAGQVVHKSLLPNGSISYSDDVPAQAVASRHLALDSHRSSQQQPAEVRDALEQNRRQLLQDFDARQQRMRELQTQIPAVEAELAAARFARNQASELRGGDRQGRRLTSQYYERQQAAALAEQQAAQRLRGLQQTYSALAP